MIKKHFLIPLLLLLLLTACSRDDTAESAAAIEAYHRALVAKDSAQLSAQSCADWESQAQIELESLGAVDVTLKDMVCTTAKVVEDSASVTCSGFLVANYGNEVLEIDLSERNYRSVFEGGEWRMCGYR
jgi:hypothetical protein